MQLNEISYGVESSKRIKNSERSLKGKAVCVEQSMPTEVVLDVLELSDSSEGSLGEVPCGIVSSDEEDSNLAWGSGHEDDDVERSIQVFDKTFTKSMVYGNQTLEISNTFLLLKFISLLSFYTLYVIKVHLFFSRCQQSMFNIMLGSIGTLLSSRLLRVSGMHV